LVVLFVSGSCYWLQDVLNYKVVAFLLLVTLSFLSLFLNILPVIAAALVSTFIWNFFFIPPRFTFHVNSAEDFFLLIGYFVIAVVHSALAYRIKQKEKRVQEEKQQASMLKLYDTLLNSLSHELRTPIATIIGATDNLLMPGGKLSDEDRRSLLLEVSVASLRLNQQVENLLNMSRLESGFIRVKMDWCDVNELVYATLKHLEENLKKHTIQINMAEDLPLFKLDSGLMEQVLFNLIFNAIHYTAENSLIIINAACVDGNCIITVEDNGKGFPPEEIERVFDKFYRLRFSKTGGTGLGLSIAKGFVEAHHGTIQLQNIATGGAKFSIKILTDTSYLNEIKNE